MREEERKNCGLTGNRKGGRKKEGRETQRKREKAESNK